MMTVLAAAAVPAVPAVGPACYTSTGSVAAYQGDLFISGSIDDVTVSCFRRKFSTAIERILIRSSGGLAASTLEIADLIAGHRVPIVVDQYCASACAYLILPAGSEIDVDPSDLVLFHNTATSVALIGGNRSWQELVAMRETAKREAAFYKRLGIDLLMLTLPQQMIDTLCVGRNLDKSTGEGVQFAAQYEATVLTKMTLENFGFHFRGSFADTPTKIATGIATGVIKQTPDFVNKLSYTIDLGKSSLPIDQLKKSQRLTSLRTMPECTAAQAQAFAAKTQ